MGQRVNIVTAARLTGRSESTWRAWLAEDPCPISVITGARHGGRKGKAGRVRWLDVDEVKALHAARGGTSWYAEHLPADDQNAERADIALCLEKIASLSAEVAALKKLFAGLAGNSLASPPPAREEPRRGLWDSITYIGI